MKKEDLFLAIGDIDNAWLERSEMPSHRKEELIMKRKPTRLLRNVLIAAAIMTILAVSVFASVNARIRMEITKYEDETTTNEKPTGPYEVWVNFRETDNEYQELPSVYPQTIPEGYSLDFVSEYRYGLQRLEYKNAAGEVAFDFIMELGGDGSEFGIKDVIREEEITVSGCPGVLYTTNNGCQCVVWYDEDLGLGYHIASYDTEVDVLSIADSVNHGERLIPTLSAEYGLALEQIGDYRITKLSEGYEEVVLTAAPLESGDGRYGYVRRTYSDKVSRDQYIYFEYELFTVDPTERDKMIAENWITTIFRPNTFEPVTVQGMSGAVRGSELRWVEWREDSYVLFGVYSKGCTKEELLALAESVVCMNDHS